MCVWDFAGFWERTALRVKGFRVLWKFKVVLRGEMGIFGNGFRVTALEREAELEQS